MASCNFTNPAAGANLRREMHKWLCCVVLLTMAITLKGACAKTVLYNKSGSDLMLIFPQSHLNKVVPPKQRVELEGEQQQRGVMIQVVQSGAVAGPLDLPNNISEEAVWPFQYSTARPAVSVDANIGNLIKLNLCIPNVIVVSKGGC